MAAAKDSDARYAAGNPRALEGLPIVVKVNIETKGDITSASTNALKDWRPKQDADCIIKLRAAGAIILSKTNMPEMALGMTGWSPLYGMCKNPYEPTRTNIGGSSSGTSASIAAGVCSAGLGSDTMGSLRLPCETVGIAGFMPSLGKWSTDGVVPCVSHKDTPGPMGATVSDLCLLDAVVQGYSATDFAMNAKPDMTKYKVGVPTDHIAGELGQGNRDALDLGISALRGSNATVREQEFFNKIEWADKELTYFPFS